MSQSHQDRKSGRAWRFLKRAMWKFLENEFGFTPRAWQHEYPDHVTIAPGPEGKVIARDKDGEAVLVGAKFGRGKVFLYGALLGYAPDEVLDAGEAQLLLDLTKN